MIDLYVLESIEEKLPKEMIMKIQPDRSSPVKGDHLKPPATERQKSPLSRSEKSRKKDVVKLSSHADEVLRLTKLAKSAPDMRLDKINAIKKQIEAGTYNVSANSVARSIADLHEKLKRDDR